MRQKEAIELIYSQKISLKDKQIWADSGCGSGTFTLALASLLNYESIIHAIDINRNSLNNIPDNYNQIRIVKHHSDFLQFDLINDLDGILMANSLHYVKDKNDFIRKAAGSLNSTGCFLIVEYDTERSNPWVPYPLSFNSLKKLFKYSGFSSIEKLNERSSVFRKEKMYSALIKK
jgi:ubiquinone/menaquinone biosynthesis C-methylase UbiE